MKKIIAAAAIALGATAVIAPAVDARPAAAESSIVQTAVAVNDDLGVFNTLIAAVSCESQAGVRDVLSQKGQYTVFAPIDSAFAAIEVTPENVCDIPGEALTDILTYHVAKGRRYSGDVLDSPTIKMLNGDRTTIDADALMVNDATLVLPYIDVEASNGVIHVIDRVLMP